jgi:hypothetical protein
MYVSTRDLVVDDDEDGDIARCGRARRRVMRSGQHVRVALASIVTLALPVLLRFVTCTDGSFDEILSTMVHVVAVSEGALIQKQVLEVAHGQMVCWDSTSE